MAVSVTLSKKPSGASSRLRHDSLILFIDRSLGRKIVPGCLRQAGAEVRTHDDFFPQDAVKETPPFIGLISRDSVVTLSNLKVS